MRFTLRTLLPFGFGGMMLIAVGLAAGLGWLGAWRLASALMEEKQRAAIALVELEVSAHLHQVERQVKGIAGMLRDGELRAEAKEEVGKVLMAALAVHPELTATRFVDAEGAVVRAYRDENGAARLAPVEMLRPPAADRAREYIGRRDLSWGEVFYSPTLGDAVVSAQMPVFVADRYVGLVGSGLTSRRLSEVVAEVGTATSLTAFILLGEDKVLAHPLLSRSPPRTSSALATTASIDDPVLAGLAEAREVTPRLIRSKDGLRTVVTSTAGQSHIVVTKEIREFGPQPWRIGVAVVADAVRPFLDVLTQLTVAALALPLAAAAAALLVARRLVRAIDRVTSGASQVAALDLDAIRPIPDSRVAELQAQANAFNRMTAALKAFATYVPRKLVIQLMATGEDAALASRERDMAVMFTDISGFTTLSEAMPAKEVAELLNHHFEILNACIEAESGTVDKYLGDGVMAFWGAPERIKQRALHVCRAALAIRAAVAADNARRAAGGLPPVGLRIAAHRGPLVVGNIGAPGRVNYTVVGDTVNVTQRLLEAARDVPAIDGVTIVLSRAVVEEAGDVFRYQPVGPLAMRGRHDTVDAVALIG
jgi:class 3 adenylate cyclase